MSLFECVTTHDVMISVNCSVCVYVCVCMRACRESSTGGDGWQDGVGGARVERICVDFRAKLRGIVLVE